jgi:hypothetical protein
MSIDKAKTGLESGRMPVALTAGSNRANNLRKALGGLLIAACGLTTGCEYFGGKSNDTVKPDQPAQAKTVPSPTAVPGEKNAPRILPEGEKPKVENSVDLFRYLFQQQPGYRTMDRGGTRAFAHFPRNDMEIVVRAATDVELPPDNVTQVKCKQGDVEYTNLWVKDGNNYYVMPDCNLPQVDMRCSTLKDAVPNLTKELNDKLTYVDRNTDEKPFPATTVFQIGGLRVGAKPGCDNYVAVIPTPPPAPTATAPAPTTYYHPTYPKAVTQEDLDKVIEDQKKRDEGQDKEISQKANQSEVDAMKWFYSCSNPKNYKTCAEAEQIQLDKQTEPKSKE